MRQAERIAAGFEEAVPVRGSIDRPNTYAVWGLFFAALVLLALAPSQMPDTYRWTEHGISESAAQGVDGAWMARAGFILFGLAVLAVVLRRQQAWAPLAAGLHSTFGASMFAVAAFSARSWDDEAPYVASEDTLHSVFATVMGFAFIGGVVAVMVARRARSTRAVLPDIAAVVITTSIPLFMSVSIWGVLQRLMFVVAALWYAREAQLDVSPMFRRQASVRLGRRR